MSENFLKKLTLKEIAQLRSQFPTVSEVEIQWLAEALPADETLLERLTEQLTAHTVTHKPLNYLIGSVPFCDITITVKPPILIPRPETEEIVYWLLKQLTPDTKLRLLDMCCGSGCIGLAVAHHRAAAQVTLVDKNSAAVALTKENSQNNKLSVTTIVSDLFTQLKKNSSFSCIIANPPYIPPADWEKLDRSVTEWEDYHALCAPEDGLYFYYRILEQAPEYLSSDRSLMIPHLVFEIAPELTDRIISHAQKHGWDGYKETVYYDINGKKRWVAFQHKN